MLLKQRFLKNKLDKSRPISAKSTIKLVKLKLQGEKRAECCLHLLNGSLKTEKQQQMDEC